MTLTRLLTASAAPFRGIFSASKQHVPCLAHVLNLAVQALLGKSGLGAAAPKDVQEMDAEVDDDCEGLIRGTIELDDNEDDDEHHDNDDHELEDDVPVPVAGNLDNSMCIKRALQKLRKGLIKIRYVVYLCSVSVVSSRHATY